MHAEPLAPSTSARERMGPERWLPLHRCATTSVDGGAAPAWVPLAQAPEVRACTAMAPLS